MQNDPEAIVLEKVTDEYPDEVRALFWRHVTPLGSDQCWEWQGKISGPGYGNFYLKGARYIAHRVSWELSTGLLLGKYFACHKCDNRACVNPSHLFPGTALDNTRDMIAKGRQKKPKTGPGKLIHLRLPPELVKQLDESAGAYGRSQFIRRAIERELEYRQRVSRESLQNTSGTSTRHPCHPTA